MQNMYYNNKNMKIKSTLSLKHAVAKRKKKKFNLSLDQSYSSHGNAYAMWKTYPRIQILLE